MRNMVIRETLRMSQELVQSESDEIAGEIEPDVTGTEKPKKDDSEAPSLFSRERRYWTAKKYLRGSDTTPPGLRARVPSTSAGGQGWKRPGHV